MANGLFDPIQPYFVLGSENYYKKIAANSPVAHFYRFKSADEIPAQNGVVPDGTVDIIFTCDKFNPTAVVAGSVESASSNIFSENRVYFGVRFVPGAFERFGGISVKELIGENADFVDVTGRRDALEKICLASSFDEQISHFMSCFGASLEESLGSKRVLVSGILNEIFASCGNVRVSSLEKILNYSRRHLLRTFTDFMGIDIKRFGSIVRFQNAITKMNHGEYATLADAWTDNGYYDQAHFQKDFRKFAMTTPRAYRKMIEASDYLNRITVVK